jgi:maltooligosyltrehalose trehalohydrolase
MQLMPLDRLGARQTGRQLQFGVYLPNIRAADGYAVTAHVIHKHDQFLQEIPAVTAPLVETDDPAYGPYWSCSADLDSGIPTGSAWGRDGRYLYRYEVTHQSGRAAPMVMDPFAREFGVGRISAITVGYQPYRWSAAELEWRTPAQSDLIMYEVNLAEFARDLNGAIGRLTYLADLGVNCIQLMPVTNIAGDVDWGYLPSGYFGVDERFGQRSDLQAFVDAAHEAGLAVLIDGVYGHTSSDFAYSYLYRALGIPNNPVLGRFGDKDDFGESTDYDYAFTRDFFFTANVFWLENFHVDGMRYDCVPNYYAGPFAGYGELAYETFRFVASKRGVGGSWERFFAPDGAIRLLQVAENLDNPVEVLDRTYSTATWQDWTLAAAADVAQSRAPQRIRDFGRALGLLSYPESMSYGADVLPKTAVQYIENHDHWRFLCNFTMSRDQADGDPFAVGDRSRWYKVQPYLIGLLSSKGVPLLYEGQELSENYSLPTQGIARIAVLRPVRWDYFYDEIGRATIWLVRTMIGLRRNRAQLRGPGHRFYDRQDLAEQDLMFFSRFTQDAWTLVALNFGDADRTVPVSLPVDGDYREELHGVDLLGIRTGIRTPVTVPSNYGRMWTAAVPVPPGGAVDI